MLYIKSLKTKKMTLQQMNFDQKQTTKKIKLLVFLLLGSIFFTNYTIAQTKVIDVETFNEVVISPHIEVLFKEGKKESVTIDYITIPVEKLNIDVKKNTLNIYLEGAKITSPKKKETKNGNKLKTSIYKGTIARIIVTYKEINNLDLRGEERFVFESNLDLKKLQLKIYGESHVFLNEVNIKNLQVSIYGESYLEIKEGNVENQKFTAYGESKINTLNIENKETKLTAYGDGTFHFNVSEKLKITSYGEATINYSGNPSLSKGLVIGETKIKKVNS